MLSEEDDWTTTMSNLAARTNSSLSRLSHVISKLEKRGWVERTRSETSGRVKMVTMTDKGYAVLVEAAPTHVEFVHSLIYDGLTEEDVESLRRLMTHVLQRIESSGLKSSC
jgi:DNA-binding MarR family transcriptional regulator